jgi:prolyl-tRNA editing enzyme YbaK/EbsC (Cys-tRNA(Pro) deacylase)
MSTERVRDFLEPLGLADRIHEFDHSSATVELAAEAVGVSPAQVAKTLAFLVDDDVVLVAVAGDARVDTKPFRALFGTRPRMAPADRLEELVGYPAGGVCPLATRPGVPLYLDESLRRFDVLFFGAGSDNSLVELTIPELEQHAQCAGWVDVCKNWRDA